jgi:ribose 5-phosphate isomerase A
MSQDPELLKRAAAAAALDEVESGMVLGLGTGSTVAHFVELLGAALEEGRFQDLRGVPTSVRTGREARAAGVPLVRLEEHPVLDLAVDGADEVGPGLDLVKGMGGALLREKMVAQAARRFCVIADAGKEVPCLGTRSPLPVEVVEWAWEVHLPFLEERGAEVRLRETEDGQPFRTDNGNPVLDCRFPDGVEDPRALEEALERRAGIVATGLFLGMAERAFLAGSGGVRIVGRDG